MMSGGQLRRQTVAGWRAMSEVCSSRQMRKVHFLNGRKCPYQLGAYVQLVYWNQRGQELVINGPSFLLVSLQIYSFSCLKSPMVWCRQHYSIPTFKWWRDNSVQRRKLCTFLYYILIIIEYGVTIVFHHFTKTKSSWVLNLKWTHLNIQIERGI